MKNITKWIVGTLCALALVTSTFAADTTAVAKASTQTQTSLFNAGELGLSLASSYDVGAASTVNGKTLFNTPYNFNLNAGAFWFPLRNVGFEANVPFYQTKGVSVDEVQAGIVLRLPLSKTTPLLKNLAPYVGVDGVYNWQNANKWAYIAKAGVEARLNSKWGVFGEAQYRNDELSKWSQGSVSLNGGLHFVF
jgi:hypothetical protein